MGRTTDPTPSGYRLSWYALATDSSNFLRHRLKIGPADVKAIREKLDQSQTEFAALIGVSVATLRNWEQGRRRPEGPARALLKVAEHNPMAVAEALRGT